MVLLLVLGGHRCAPGPYTAGQVAPHDIRAREHGFIEDLDVTKERQQARRNAVPDVFVQRTGFGAEQTARLGGIFVVGRELLELSPRELRRQRRDFQMIFQDPYGSLNPRMTVRKILAEPIEVHRLIAKAEMPGRLRELLEHDDD